RPKSGARWQRSSCRPPTSAPQLGDPAAQLDHRQAGRRRVAALVLAIDTGAGPGLVVVLHRENAVAQRQAVAHREILQRPRALAADVVVVGGLTADDA